MSRLLNILLVSALAGTPVTWAQSPRAVSNKNTTKAEAPVTPGAAQSPKTEEDCGCESQVLPEAFAIVNGVRISRKDIEDQLRGPRVQLQRQVIEARKRELDLQVNSKLVALEAARRSVSVTKLLEVEVVSKVTEPTETEARAFYEQNKKRIEGEFPDVRNDITRYLRDEREHAEAKKFAERLRSTGGNKVKILEAASAQPASDRARVFATVNQERITSADIEDSLRPLVYEVQQQIYKLRQSALDLKINDTLLEQEAQKRKITTDSLVVAEIKPMNITEEAARAFYDQNRERVSGEFPQTKDHIIQYLQQDALRKAELAFVEKLRRVATIETFLVAPQPPVFNIATDDQPSLGDAAAPVTIIAFTDYQCPSCASTQPVLEKLLNEYEGRVRLVVRDFPLEQHKDAFKAAEAAEAAREQGKYWEYTALLLQNQPALGVESLKQYAGKLGLDRQKFDAALDSSKFAEKVQRDLWEGVGYGVNSTPALFINGRRLTNNSYESLKAATEAALKAAADISLPTVKRSAGKG
ncbi:MAG: thioredoxin domain-containing protein [Acidobacteriota bacterium]